jgi:two-component system, NtrC family, C4-dicarboxylate transport response regulator DctD
MCVVIVDDDRPMLRTHARVLRAHGLETVAFTDPIEAFASILATPPSVVIVDVALPAMSGLELASRVRFALNPSHPSLVLVSSSHAELTPREVALFDVIHPKPYAIDRFVADVKRAARQYADRASFGSVVIRKEDQSAAKKDDEKKR